MSGVPGEGGKSRHEWLADFGQRLLSGELVTAEEWLQHFDAQNEGAVSGLEVGSTAPDFELLNQYGLSTSLESVMGDEGLVLVFARSAHFCGYCRNQLAEMQQNDESLRSVGVHQAAVTPDAVDVLREFSDAQRLTYPLLSDLGSATIKAFGVLNHNHPDERGLPFPGQFFITPDGVIRAKAFTGDLRRRASTSALVADLVARPAGTPQVVVQQGPVSVGVRLASDRVFPGQEIALRVDVAVEDGWHVYDENVIPPYVGLSVSFEGDDLVDFATLTGPEPTRHDFVATGEQLLWHSGSIQLSGRLGIRTAPLSSITKVNGLEHLAEQWITPGDHTLRGEVKFQACTESECLAPVSLPFELSIQVEKDVPSVRSLYQADD